MAFLNSISLKTVNILLQQTGPKVEEKSKSTLQLPQFDANISRMLTYSQDFITLDCEVKVKWIDFRT
jgi:hypothetical protein